MLIYNTKIFKPDLQLPYAFYKLDYFQECL